MLRELQLTNFKSFAGEPQTIPLAPVTVFVGANGSGKSNVFDAIRILQGIGSGLSLNDALNGQRSQGRTSFPGVRGGAGESLWEDQPAFTIRAAVDISAESLRRHPASLLQPGEYITPDEFDWRFGHEISVRVEESSIKVASEHLASPTESDLLRMAGGRVIAHFGNGAPVATLSGAPADEGVVVPSSMEYDANTLDLSFSLASDVPANWIAFPRLRRSCAILMRSYEELTFLDIKPEQMKRHVPLQSTSIGSMGENLSAIVHRLCADSNLKDRFLEWMSSLCAPKVTDITFDRTGLGDVLVQFVEANGAERIISARTLSDGTLRFLALLAAVFSTPAGTTILLEEIENGLHPTRVHLLVELFEQVAEDRGIQIIATTHSERVLSALSKAALENVVVFTRGEEYPGTKVTRLGGIPHFEDVTRETRIGELFTTGWMEFAVP